jgi:uncharacterized membrane protein YeiH
MPVDPQRVIYVFDLFGTASFAFSGAIRAMDRRPDFVGMLILAGATAVGGSVLRDVFLSRNVMILHDWGYPLVILLSVIATCLFPLALCRKERFFKCFDAVGLGTFSAITANAAWGSPGINPLSILFVATFTGCAGGVIRDLLIQKQTLVLANELYVTPVVIGAAGLMVVRAAGFSELAGCTVAMPLAAGIRLMAIYWDWRLPRIRHVPQMVPEISAWQVYDGTREDEEATSRRKR